MAAIKLSDISAKMRNLDICLFTTQTSRGLLSSRPMSNNGDVEYDGNSYFFTYEASRIIKDIEGSAQVNLSFEGPKGLYISVAGKAKAIRNKQKMAEHWVDSLQQWFQQGLDTPYIVMVQVKATRIKYWQGEEEGEVKI